MTVELKPSQFEDFFRAIHGCDPFPWQQALVNRLAETNEWPDILDLPTGAGKTAVLDAAVFHLALRAATPEKVAIRIVLVVDRRLVVDDAYIRAKRIASVLDGIETNQERLVKGERTVILEVSRRLRHLTGEEGEPLVAERLRGGVPLEHEWARMPTQPTILCSTVDQVGSRLLFRGYGVSDRMKPVHAGLLGQDSLIFLDEAHLSRPFWQTLSSLQRIGHAEIRTALLSATPGSNPKRPLELSRADRRHPILKKRLEAPKPARLHEPYKGREEFMRALTEIAGDMAKRLKGAGVSAPAVGVVVNRVSLAREVFNQLTVQHPDTLLMIGRARSVVRDRIVDKQLMPFRTNSAKRVSAAPLFVVATQCLEVGVDLDLDGLVTQAAPIDALRQRFGRLNRAGRDICAEGAILTLAEDVAPNADDPIYGKQIRATWDALKALSQKDIVDFGIAQAENWNQDLSGLVAPESDAPVLMPAYLDLWSQTSPVPAADPDVNLFLHGVTHSSADVSLVWRSDLKKKDMAKSNEKALEELMSLVPPRPGEMLEVPLWAARKWLADESIGIESVSDVPGKDSSSPIQFGVRVSDRRPAFRWAGRDNPRTKVVKYLNDIGPGDVLIVPAECGGCDDFGWAPEFNRLVEDVADQAAFPDVVGRVALPKGYAVRVARDCVKTEHRWKQLAAILAEDSAAEIDTIDRLIGVFSSIEEEDSDCNDQEAEQPVRDVRARLEKLRQQHQSSIAICRYADGLTAANDGSAILIVQKGPTGLSGACSASTEDDSLSHSALTVVSLDDHSQHVESWAKSFCQHLGLPAHLEEDITLAAFLHDAGKADPRFQIMLRGGHIWNHSDDDSVIAKSGRPWDRLAWSRANLPKGWRHEALSVRMASAHPRFAQAHDPRLILWLIGTHHGFGRPFFNFTDGSTRIDPLSCLGCKTELVSSGPGPESMAFDYDGDDWSSLFEKLKEEYGVWRLAQFEAILRLADHRASEKGRGA